MVLEVDVNRIHNGFFNIERISGIEEKSSSVVFSCVE